MGVLWCLTPPSTIFQIVAVSFIGGGNHWSVASHWQTLMLKVALNTITRTPNKNSIQLIVKKMSCVI
jgi:hypothetical protein